MFSQKLRQRLSRCLLVFSALILAAEPVQAFAQPAYEPPADAIDVMLESGDRYLTAVADLLVGSAEVVRRLDAVNATPVTALSEEAVQQTREAVVEMARQASLASGAIDDFAASVESLGGPFFAPLDLESEAAAGIPGQFRSDLVEVAGLSDDQADRAASAYAALADTRLGFAGLPAEVRAQLTASGLTDSEIDRLDAGMASRGFADESIGDALSQLRATQDELASVRSRAQMTGAQLLSRQIAVRQAAGIAPRVVTEAELEALANDELRLLIHVAQLQELWGSDPDLDLGEGQWWFIERYATRAAERLEAITLDTQNLGLIGELFLVRNLADLAAGAAAGGPEHAKDELDAFVVLLQVEVGDEDFVSQQRQQFVGVGKTLARLTGRPLLREQIAWPVARADRAAYAVSARERLETSGLWQPTSIGAFEELNEANNQLAYLFAAGLPFFGQLATDVLLTALDVIAFVDADNIEIWLRAILTGRTDDPALLIGSVIFGLLPVIGVIQDIISLAIDPSVVIKAISLVGIVGGIVELATFIPGLQPAGVGGILGKATATVLKGLQGAAEVAFPAFRGVMRGLRIREAFDVIVDLIRVTLRGVSGFPSSLDEIGAFVGDLLTGTRRLWDNFIHFVQRVGVELLVRLGVHEGTDLVGRMFALSPELAGVSDETIEALARLGRELVEGGIDLSDEAAQGLGVVARGVAGPGTEIFVRGIRSDLLDDTLKAIGRAGGSVQWTDEALEGVSNVVRVSQDLGPAKIETLLRVIGDPQIASETFRALKFITSSWSDQALEGVSIAVRHSGGTAERALRVLASADPILDQIRGPLGDRLFRLVSQGNASTLGQTDEWPGFVRTMLSIGVEGGAPFSNLFGGSHVLFFIEESGGFGGFTALEFVVDRAGIIRRYDLVGQGNRLYELKNVSTLATEAVDQLVSDLRILSDEELRSLTWVFRGSENQLPFNTSNILDRVRSRIISKFEDPLRSELLSRIDPTVGAFGPANILFTGGSRPFP